MRASSALVGVRSLQIHVQLRANCSQLSQRSASALPAAQPWLCGARQALVLAPGGLEAFVISTGQFLRLPGAVPTGYPQPPHPARSQSSARESPFCTRGQSSEILLAQDHLSCDSKMLGATHDFEASRGMYVGIAFRRISCVALRPGARGSLSSVTQHLPHSSTQLSSPAVRCWRCLLFGL